jgi:hypothetical protein
MSNVDARIAEYLILEPPTSEGVDREVAIGLVTDSVMHLLVEEVDDSGHLSDPMVIEMLPFHFSEATRRVLGCGPGITSMLIELAYDPQGPATASIVWDTPAE